MLANNYVLKYQQKENVLGAINTECIGHVIILYKGMIYYGNII